MSLVFVLLSLTTSFIAALIFTLTYYVFSIVVPEFTLLTPVVVFIASFFIAHLIFLAETAIYKKTLAVKYRVDISIERAEYKKSKSKNDYPFLLHYLLLIISMLLFLLSIIVAYFLGLTTGFEAKLTNVFVTTFGLLFSYTLALLIIHIMFLNKNVRQNLGRKGVDFTFSIGLAFFIVLTGGLLIKFLYDTFLLLGLISF